MTDTITRGTSNVFADLGRPDAGERQTKTRLAMAVNEIIADRKLRQADAAQLLGVPQPRISSLKNYKLNDFSVQKLMDFLTALDQDVEINIRPHLSEGPSAVYVLKRA